MNAYLSSTTLLGTPTALFGAASTASGEWGGEGATVGCVLAATLVALCVAARALSFCVERRRERRLEEARARKRRENEARAAVCDDFWKNNGNSVNYATANDYGDFDGRERRDGDFVRIASRNRREDVRENNRRDRRGKNKTRAEKRFAAPRVAAFWTVVALGLTSVLPTLRPTDGPADGATDASSVPATEREVAVETTFAATDDERRWNETNVDFRNVADSEGTRWEGASLLQNAENAKSGQSGQNGGKNASASNSANGTNGDAAASLIVERRAVDGIAVDAPKTRWVQTTDGKLTQVAQIRAEASLEVPANSTDSLNSVYPPVAQGGEADATRKTNAPERAANEAWRRRATERAPQTTQGEQTQGEQVAASARNEQNLQFGTVAQNLSAARSGQAPALARIPQGLPTARPEQVSRFEQTAQASAAPSETPARFAQTSRTAQVASVAQTPQVGRAPQNEQNEQAAAVGRETQTAQTAQTARRWQNASSRDAVVASVYDESRGFKAKNALAQEFAPSAPLIPYPSEERRPSIASVSYEPRPVGSLSLLEQIDAEFQRIGARVRKSVLSIETTKRAPKTKSSKNAVETGSGFLFQYREKIYLATNMHVVKDATSNRNVKIFLPDRTTIHPTKIATCADFDLAALELDPATLPNDGSVALCYFGDSDELQVSNFVGTVGNPFGLRDTVTYGHVSSLQRRKNDFTSDGEKSLLEFIQVDAAINPGNSGGPLYNARGEVVGVVAAIATTTGKSEGVAFAIPINLALTVLKSTIDSGGWSRSRMGVELEAAEVADFQGVVDWPIKSGSRVVNVAANSPAERAGLRGGDVVVEFEGEAIEDDVHFARLIAIADVSRPANVKFLRGGELRETTARLERSVATE